MADSNYIDPPQAGDDSRDLWKTVAELCNVVNPFMGLTISPKEAGEVIWAEGNITLRLTSTTDNTNFDGLSKQWVQFNAFGQIAYAQVLMSTLTTMLPDDAVVVNAS